MDLSQELGFVSALYHAARLRVGGHLLAAPVCSSFVFMQLAPHIQPSSLKALAVPFNVKLFCRESRGQQHHTFVNTRSAAISPRSQRDKAVMQ